MADFDNVLGNTRRDFLLVMERCAGAFGLEREDCRVGLRSSGMQRSVAVRSGTSDGDFATENCSGCRT